MPAETTLRAAIYARQSIDVEQGIQQQVAACDAEAKRRGMAVVENYRDNDVSGTKERGPQTAWAQMLRDFDAGLFDVLVVNDVDRLTRRLADVLEVRPPRRAMRVVVVRGGIDTADPTGDFVFTQFVLLAEREVRVKTQRAAAYAVERRKIGHPHPGATAYGYRWVPARERDAAGTRFAIVPKEANVVRRIFAEFKAGGNLGQIARDLREEGVSTRKGGKWHTSTIRRILLNPIYAALLPAPQPSGQHSVNYADIETCVPGAWDPIVSVDEVVLARAALLSRKPQHNGTARKWLLSGLAVCSECRAPVRSARGEAHPTTRKDGGRAKSRRYHAYRCTNGHFMRNGDLIDELAAKVAIGRISADDAADLLAPNESSDDIVALRTHIQALEERQASIANLIASGKMQPTAANNALDTLKDEISQTTIRIAEATANDPLADVVGLDDAWRWWDEATLNRRRALIEALMTVVIHPIGKGRRATTIDQVAQTVSIEWKDPSKHRS